MFGLNLKIFIGLLNFSGSLINMANASSLTRCISLNNRWCMARATLIDLNPDEYNQGLYYYPFMVNLDRCNKSCNTFYDLSSKIGVQNKIVFNMITEINESITLMKYI